MNDKQAKSSPDLPISFTNLEGISPDKTYTDHHLEPLSIFGEDSNTNNGNDAKSSPDLPISFTSLERISPDKTNSDHHLESLSIFGVDPNTNNGNDAKKPSRSYQNLFENFAQPSCKAIIPDDQNDTNISSINTDSLALDYNTANNKHEEVIKATNGKVENSKINTETSEKTMTLLDDEDDEEIQGLKLEDPVDPYPNEDSNVPEPDSIMVFTPTWEEFKNFTKYLEFIERQKAHHVGLAKIIPPKEWIPRRSGYDDIDLIVEHPISQQAVERNGGFEFYRREQPSIPLKEFKDLANSPRYCPPKMDNFLDLEKRYWQTLSVNPAQYGADVCASITDKDQDHWNIQRLGSILDILGEDDGKEFEGVNTPYMYFGMWKASFAWHTEDMDLYSINYVHHGAPKSWYCVPPEDGTKLEAVAAEMFPNQSNRCQAFLRHKSIMIPPSILRSRGIRVHQITQQAGEIMITFPYSYHAGFNHGFNIAESTNFALPRWVEYGKRCTLCNCGHARTMVRIHMDCFVKRLQPEKYDAWKQGKDLATHPHDRCGLLRGRISPSERFHLIDKVATAEEIENTIGSDHEQDIDDITDADFQISGGEDSDEDYVPFKKKVTSSNNRNKSANFNHSINQLNNFKKGFPMRIDHFNNVHRMAMNTADKERHYVLNPNNPVFNKNALKKFSIPVVKRYGLNSLGQIICLDDGKLINDPRTKAILNDSEIATNTKLIGELKEVMENYRCGDCDNCKRSPCGSSPKCWHKGLTDEKQAKKRCINCECLLARNVDISRINMMKEFGLSIFSSSKLRINKPEEYKESFGCDFCDDKTRYKSKEECLKHYVEVHDGETCSYVQGHQIGEFNADTACVLSTLTSGIPTLPCTVNLEKLQFVKETSEDNDADGKVYGIDDVMDPESNEQYILYSCNFCNKQSLNKPRMQKHMNKHAHICKQKVRQNFGNLCARRNIVEQMKSVPLTANSGTFKCILCNSMTFKVITDLSRHILELHCSVTPAQEGDYSWRCLLCLKLYGDYDSLEIHIYAEHKMSAAMLTKNKLLWQVAYSDIPDDTLQRFLKNPNMGVYDPQEGLNGSNPNIKYVPRVIATPMAPINIVKTQDVPNKPIVYQVQGAGNARNVPYSKKPYSALCSEYKVVDGGRGHFQPQKTPENTNVNHSPPAKPIKSNKIDIIEVFKQMQARTKNTSDYKGVSTILETLQQIKDNNPKENNFTDVPTAAKTQRSRQPRLTVVTTPVNNTTKKSKPATGAKRRSNNMNVVPNNSSEPLVKMMKDTEPPMKKKTNLTAIELPSLSFTNTFGDAAPAVEGIQSTSDTVNT